MAQLPPKIPNMSPSWPDFSSYQKMPSHASFGTNPQHHQNNNNNTSWVDEFLDFSSGRRSAHRRSMSDSITFLEASPITTRPENNDNEFEKFDHEQFMSMFNDEIYGVNVPPTLSSSNPSSPSDQNFKNDEKETKNNEKEVLEQQKKQEEEEEEQQQDQLKNEPDEVESECKQEFSTPPNNTNATITTTSSNDRITDPKRVKR